MTDEEADRASETDAPSPTTVLVRVYVNALSDLLEELRHSLASNGSGVDREPAAVLRDLDEAIAQLAELPGVLAAIDKAWEGMHACAIATENGGFCAITFYGGEDLPDLTERASRDEPRAKLHLQLTSLVTRALETNQPPRCVVCSEDVDEPRLLQLIMLLEGYGEGPERTAAGAICVHCANEHQSEAALRNAVVKAFRERLQVDLRVLQSAPVLPGRVHWGFARWRSIATTWKTLPIWRQEAVPPPMPVRPKHRWLVVITGYRDHIRCLARYHDGTNDLSSPQ